MTILLVGARTLVMERLGFVSQLLSGRAFTEEFPLSDGYVI
jgi:hypothetical protein